MQTTLFAFIPAILMGGLGLFLQYFIIKLAIKHAFREMGGPPPSAGWNGPEQR